MGKRDLNLEYQFRVFIRVLESGLGIEMAFYVVMGDYTGKDSLYGKLDYVTDMFKCSYGEMVQLEGLLGLRKGA